MFDSTKRTTTKVKDESETKSDWSQDLDPSESFLKKYIKDFAREITAQDRVKASLTAKSAANHFISKHPHIIFVLM